MTEFDDLVKRSQGSLRIVTLAPELEGALDLVAAACSAGVVASIGHTDADHATAKAAFDAGARLATHLFNAMAPIHHRRPGPSPPLSTTRGCPSRSLPTGSTSIRR